MTTPEEGLATQVRNIEKTYGRSMAEWTDTVRAAGTTKHSEIIAMLKREYGVSHGNANRIALVARDAIAAKPGSAKADADPIAVIYSGKKTGALPIHEALMAQLEKFGGDFDVSPKRGYVSLRRRKQFAMLQPAADRVDLGLILKDTPTTARLEAAGSFNAMFTHRVRVTAPEAVDAELAAWLKRAYDAAG